MSNPVNRRTFLKRSAETAASNLDTDQLEQLLRRSDVETIDR